MRYDETGYIYIYCSLKVRKQLSELGSPILTPKKQQKHQILSVHEQGHDHK